MNHDHVTQYIVERRASSSRIVCKISGETARILSKCMRVVLVNNTVTYTNEVPDCLKHTGISVAFIHQRLKATQNHVFAQLRLCE